MRVSELVAKLQELDPTGQAEVAVMAGRPGDEWATRVVDAGDLYPRDEQPHRRVLLLDIAEASLHLDDDCVADPDAEDDQLRDW